MNAVYSWILFERNILISAWDKLAVQVIHVELNMLFADEYLHFSSNFMIFINAIKSWSWTKLFSA